jgi:hypothetical protein
MGKHAQFGCFMVIVGLAAGPGAARADARAYLGFKFPENQPAPKTR